MALVVLDSRIVLDYLLGQPGGVCALASITCYTWMDTSMEGETPLHKITEQASWLKRLTPSMGSLVGLSIVDHDSELHSKHWR